MNVMRLFLITLLAVVLVACGGRSNNDSSESPEANDPAENAQPVEATPNVGSIDVDVSGAYTTTLNYVSFERTTGEGGVYTMRFFVDASEAASPVENDLVIVLPNDVRPGAFIIAPGIGPERGFATLDSPVASVVVNLAPRGEAAYAASRVVTGDVALSSTADNSLSGTFQIVVGDGDQQMIIDGQMRSLSGSILP